MRQRFDSKANAREYKYPRDFCSSFLFVLMINYLHIDNCIVESTILTRDRCSGMMKDMPKISEI